MSIPAVQVSDGPLNAVLSRISDSVAGLNPMWVQQAAAYGIDPMFLSIDFVSDPSKNFFLAQVEPDQLEESGNISYPFTCLYVLDTMQKGYTKFSTFSGDVNVIFDSWLSWEKTSGLRNFEIYGICLESCIISIVNEAQNQNWGQSNQSVTYNGYVRCKRGPCTLAGENWRQKLGFSFVFEVDTK